MPQPGGADSGENRFMFPIGILSIRGTPDWARKLGSLFFNGLAERPSQFRGMHVNMD